MIAKKRDRYGPVVQYSSLPIIADLYPPFVSVKLCSPHLCKWLQVDSPFCVLDLANLSSVSPFVFSFHPLPSLTFYFSCNFTPLFCFLPYKCFVNLILPNVTLAFYAFTHFICFFYPSFWILNSFLALLRLLFVSKHHSQRQYYSFKDNIS